MGLTEAHLPGRIRERWSAEQKGLKQHGNLQKCNVRGLRPPSKAHQAVGEDWLASCEAATDHSRCNGR